MSAGDIYAKTPLGVQEVSSRKMKLNPRLRTMLILVDGRSPAFILQVIGEQGEIDVAMDHAVLRRGTHDAELVSLPGS